MSNTWTEKNDGRLVPSSFVRFRLLSIRNMVVTTSFLMIPPKPGRAPPKKLVPML
ncbi:hypothetical protein D3C87_2176500 [compost metagenome]